MDDVIIYSNALQDRFCHVDKISTTLAEACVALKMMNCTFFRYKVEFLNHLIRQGNVGR